MAHVNVTGFQRARRLAAAKAKAEASETARQEADFVALNSNVPRGTSGDPENPNVPREKFEGLTPEDIDALDVEQVKDFLNAYDVSFAHNTGEEKLREKLKDAAK